MTVFGPIRSAFTACVALAFVLSPVPRRDILLGKNLALAVAKWEGRAGIPGKPFVIWALGSSYTDRQGDGYELIQAIRQRFPNAPPIIETFFMNIAVSI